MKTMVLRIDLEQALKNACLVASKKGTDSPILQNVLLTADGESLTLLTTDYDQVYREKILADTQETGAIAVNAFKLYDVIKKAKDFEVYIEVNPSNYLELKIGKLKTRLPGILSTTFPEITLNDYPFAFSLEKGKLEEIAGLTLPFIGENEARKNLMGLNMRKDRGIGRIAFMGADAFRIAEKIEESENVRNDAFNVTFPGTGLKIAAKIFKGDKTEIKIKETANFLQIVSGNKFYQSRLIDAVYPNLSRLLETPFRHAVIESPVMVDCLDMIEAVTDKSDKKTVVKLVFDSDSLKMETQKTEFSDGSVSIVDGYTFVNSEEPLTVGLNLYFLKQTVSMFKKSDYVIAGCEKPENPFVMTSPSIPYYKTVLMPVRIQW